MSAAVGGLLALTPRPAPHAVLVPVGDEAVVVDEAWGHLHLLNHTGALLWQMLDGVSPLDELCADVSDAWDVPRATVDADVVALVDRLLRDGLVVAPGVEPPPLPDEVGDPCGCEDHDHDHDLDADFDGELLEIRGNP